jgi:hypothetical protein
MELAMLIMSSASFMIGSARGLYGSGSGDNSAVVGKPLVQSQKEPKLRFKNITYAPFTFNSFFGSSSFLSGFMGFLFIFLYNFVGQFPSIVHPDIRIKFFAH